MKERFRQENTAFLSPLTEHSSCEEISESEEEPDQRQPHLRKKVFSSASLTLTSHATKNPP